MIQCKTCGMPEYCLVYLPEEAQWHCPLCDSRTPDDRRVGIGSGSRNSISAGEGGRASDRVQVDNEQGGADRILDQELRPSGAAV